MQSVNKIEPPTFENEQTVVAPQPHRGRAAWFSGARLLAAAVAVGGVIYLGQHWIRNWTEWDFHVEVSSTRSNMTLTFDDGTQMNLTLIPAGEFTMGSPEGEEGRKSWDGPQRRVTISKPFYIGICEVTQGQYKAVMGKNPSGGFTHIAKSPVNHVSWEDAIEFCRKLSAKISREVDLPTEAQWEYACRAGTTTPYNVGKTISGDQSNYMGTRPCGCGCTSDNPCIDRDMTVPVGTFKPNGFGLYDMHGNVSEWCRDWFDIDFHREASRIDPENTTTSEQRVHRGGSWLFGPEECRSAARSSEYPNYYNVCLGFRVIVRQSIEEGAPNGENQ